MSDHTKLPSITDTIAHARDHAGEPNQRVCAMCGQTYSPLHMGQVSHHEQSGPHEPMPSARA
jgi:hypothetical protein